jgi:hopanoid C-2 methylase
LDVNNERHVLCVFPRFNPCFASFHHTRELYGDTIGFMPPQGMLTVAAYLPDRWQVRFRDENVTPLCDEDREWADVVMVSGMHPQRKRMAEIARWAHGAGKVAVVGGSSVSACAGYHPDFDILHMGELGDATDQLIAHLDRTVERPESQLVFTTRERLPLDDFPIPAYDQVDLKNYMVLSIQWSSGCPYTCEFCDIPELYGRKARMKSPERLIAELDAIIAHRPIGGIWFVDDNLIANKRAAKELMRHLIAWQERTGHQLRFAGEASLNLAQDEEMLALMRDAYFTDLFVGIESSDTATLKAISKNQNTRLPILDAVKAFNDHGIELSAGIIFGFDSDGEDTADKAIRFIQKANIPIVGLNVLYALPRTPLWRRLEAEGRLLPDADVDESNIAFKLGSKKVLDQFHRAVDALYAPEALYQRYRHNIKHTYPNRKKLPLLRYRISKETLELGMRVMSRMMWKLGVRSRYKRVFWKLAVELIRAGKIDHLLYIGSMGHHLIRYREDVLAGRVRASTFSHRPGEPLVELRTSA